MRVILTENATAMLLYSDILWFVGNDRCHVKSLIIFGNTSELWFQFVMVTKEIDLISLISFYR